MCKNNFALIAPIAILFQNFTLVRTGIKNPMRHFCNILIYLQIMTKTFNATILEM